MKVPEFVRIFSSNLKRFHPVIDPVLSGIRNTLALRRLYQMTTVMEGVITNRIEMALSSGVFFPLLRYVLCLLT